MFDLTISPKRQVDEGFIFYPGQLLLGNDVEFLACGAVRWKPMQYRRQWLAAARRLLQRSQTTSAFVTSVGRGRRTNRVEWWPAKRKGTDVVFRNQLLFVGYPWLRLVPGRAHEYAHLFAFRLTPGAKPSEWRVRVGDIRKFLARRGNVA